MQREYDHIQEQKKTNKTPHEVDLILSKGDRIFSSCELLGGNLYVSPPGNFDDTAGRRTGIAFKSEAEGTLSGKGPSLSRFGLGRSWRGPGWEFFDSERIVVVGTASEELAIVESLGRGISRDDAGREGVGVLSSEWIGTCSAV